jgi:O-antigen ligase
MITFSRIPSPHNVILELMCYSGIIGLTIYLVYFYQICKRGYQSYKRKGLLLPILLLIYIFGMLFTGQILYDKIGWIIFAYTVGSTSIPYNLSLPTQQLKQI